MKKLLLTLAAVAMCTGAAFADANIVVADVDQITSSGDNFTGWSGGDFTFTVAKNNGSTAPTYSAKGKDVRLYAKNSLNVTATNDMTKIVFTLSAQGKKRLPPITASTGTIATQAVGDVTVTWTGAAKDVTFTVGEKAEFGSDTGKAGQFDFEALAITGGGEFTNTPVTPPTPPTPGEPNYFKATTIESGEAYVFVAGGKYNVLFDRNYGYMSVTDLPEGTTDSFEGNSDAAMTFTAVEGGFNITTTGGKMLGAKDGYKTFDTTDDSANNRVWTATFAADGTVTIVNVATGKTVAQDPQYGSFGCYDAADLEGKVLPNVFKFQGEVVVPPTPDTVTFEKTASIVSGAQYVMVVNMDGKDYVGTSISQSSTYGRLNLEEITISGDKFSTIVTNALTISAEGEGYAIKDTYGRYLGYDGEHNSSFQLYTTVDEKTIWKIEFTNGQAVMTLTMGENTAQIGVTKGSSGTWYNNLSLSVGATEILMPTLYVQEGTSGIEGVAVENADAPVEYFNMQGMRVENPANGLYVRRQGNNVSKVYVR